MSRSKWKGPFIEKFLIKTIKANIKIWSRASIISKKYIGKFVHIHSGLKKFQKILISREKVGFKFGEFANTRKLGTHKFKTKKQKK